MVVGTECVTVTVVGTFITDVTELTEAHGTMACDVFAIHAMDVDSSPLKSIFGSVDVCAGFETFETSKSDGDDPVSFNDGAGLIFVFIHTFRT